MKNLILAALACAFLTAGCATPETMSSNESATDREYPTGSNIPRKREAGPQAGVSVTDREAIERSGVTQIPMGPPRGRGAGSP